MSDAIRAQLKSGQTMDQLMCIEDGDKYHWRCVTTTLDGKQRYRLTVAITCDQESALCLSEPALYVPLDQNP